jgi:hypothetical protein
LAVLDLGERVGEGIGLVGGKREEIRSGDDAGEAPGGVGF